MTADDGVFTVPGRQQASCRHLSTRTGRMDLVPSLPSWRDLRRHYRPRLSDGTVENTDPNTSSPRLQAAMFHSETHKCVRRLQAEEIA